MSGFLLDDAIVVYSLFSFFLLGMEQNCLRATRPVRRPRMREQVSGEYSYLDALYPSNLRFHV